MKNIISFLKNLKANNNREWFGEHKSEYEIAKNEFEKLGNELILKIAELDSEIGKVNIKDCVFRIFRDIRFSHDKTPYKTHFGLYIAYPDGRKSERGGYYLHIDPNENCFLAAGIWSPLPPMLKALRRSVFENYDELEEIIREPDFYKYFGNSFYQEDKLKKLPAGFPADFKDPEILKLKHYLVSSDLSIEQVLRDDFIDYASQLAKTAYPFVQFLNYTVDEINH